MNRATQYFTDQCSQPVATDHGDGSPKFVSWYNQFLPFTLSDDGRFGIRRRPDPRLSLCATGQGGSGAFLLITRVDRERVGMAEAS